MDTSLPAYEVFALRYATREARRHEHFIGGDPHDGPMPMDYFVCLIPPSRRKRHRQAAVLVQASQKERIWSGRRASCSRTALWQA